MPGYLFEAVLRSEAIGAQYRYLQTSLNALAHQAAHENWDGEGASALSEGSLAFAKHIAQVLPVTEPRPEVTVDPDGEVSFDWQRDRRRTLSMSIDPSGTLRFASILGSSENFGVEAWSDGLPERIFLLLQKVTLQEPV